MSHYVFISRSLSVVAVGAMGMLLLSGCANNQDEAADSNAMSSTAPTGSSIAPTPTDAAETLPGGGSADQVTCTNVLTPQTMADFDAGGYALQTSLPSGPDPTMASLLEMGGLSCYWSAPGDDVVAWLGQAAMDGQSWSTLRADRLANGFAETNDPIPGTIQGERLGDDYPALVNSDGVTYYVGYSGLLASVVSLH